MTDKKPYPAARRSFWSRLTGPLPRQLAAGRFALLVAAAAVALSFLVSNRYMASATFYLDSGRPGTAGAAAAAGGDLASIASSVGLLGATSGVSPYLVSELVTSDTVLTDIVRMPIPPKVFLKSEPARTLIEHYDLDEKTPERRFWRTVQQLRDRVNSTVGNRSGIVTLNVWDHDPGVAAWLTSQVLERTQHYLGVARSSRARAERIFVEGRERSVRDSLAKAQDQLAGFLSANRVTSNSPVLQMREQALRREVDIATTLYSAVQRDVERARADEVRETPVLTVTATPVPPIKKSWPKRSIIGAVAFVLAFGLYFTRQQWSPAVEAVGAALERPAEA